MRKKKIKRIPSINTIKKDLIMIIKMKKIFGSKIKIKIECIIIKEMMKK